MTLLITFDSSALLTDEQNEQISIVSKNFIRILNNIEYLQNQIKKDTRKCVIGCKKCDRRFATILSEIENYKCICGRDLEILNVYVTKEENTEVRKILFAK
jgi:hypothetical protein